MINTDTSLAGVAAFRPWPYGPPLRGRAPRGNASQPATYKKPHRRRMATLATVLLERLSCSQIYI